MLTDQAEQGGAGTIDALGALRLDQAARRPAPPAARSNLASGIALAGALHLGLALAFSLTEHPAGFVDRPAELEAIGVEIVVTSTPGDLSAEIEARGGQVESEASSAAAAGQDQPRPEERQVEPPAPEIAERTTAPPDDEAPAAEQLGSEEAAPVSPWQQFPQVDPSVSVTALMPSLPSAASEPSARGGEAAAETPSPAAPSLPVEPGGGREASGYEKSVFEVLRRRPPRAPTNRRGTVRISFSIGPDGKVASARVQSSSGSAEIDAAALEVVRTARFAPPPNTAAGSLEYEIPYTFR